MLAFRRLGQAFESSKEIPISNRSRIVFMSDCHRGDGSPADDFSPNKHLYLYALNRYYRAGYTYIEIGDSDELWENRSFKRILKAHEDVFLLLRKSHVAKRLYVIWGNHDIAKRSKQYLSQNLYYRYNPRTRKRVPLLNGLESYEGLILRHRESNVRVFVVHGHQADFVNDQLWPIACMLARYVWRPLEILDPGPDQPSKEPQEAQSSREHPGEVVDGHRQIMIAGHTHRPSFPERGEAPYVNDGSCAQGLRDCRRDQPWLHGASKVVSATERQGAACRRQAGDRRTTELCSHSSAGALNAPPALELGWLDNVTSPSQRLHTSWASCHGSQTR